MKKKIISALLCAAMATSLLAGCGSSSAGSSSTTTSAATEAAASTETAAKAGESAGSADTDSSSGSYAGQKIALVGKSAGNAFFEIAAATFVSTVESEGGTVDIVYPEEATADAQIKVLDNLISQDYDAICLSANDTNALQAKLEEAMDAGIAVSSFDSAPNADSRQIFVNQAGTTAVAQALVDAVYDITGGEGQWAILSATSQASNQNAWIDAMKAIIAANDQYANLELVEVAYGDDEAQKSTDQTEALLQNYPDLKVICAPTTVGIAAAAKYLQDNSASCKLTGLGLPSEMEAYTGDGDDYSCPYFYLWDMEGLGTLSAYATMALVSGEITGALDETFTAGDLGEYTITAADDGGTEIVLGLPLEFTPENVSEYAKLY
ncbi:MAG: substrate-binding domain-containing protein [Clostridiales bacterium]|nr:substrate-binding domain-containing protein [Clostridiales bacterium]